MYRIVSSLTRQERYDAIASSTLGLLIRRFWPRVVVVPGKCWAWTGATRSNYASIDVPGQRGFAIYGHVFSFFLRHGRWPERGRIICHTRDCTSKECVNPDHLYEGTHTTNAQDREAVRSAA